MLKPVPITPAQLLLKKDIDKLLKKYSRKASSQEVLVIISQCVGMIIALQDQRTMTPELAMEIVAQNIQIGNQIVLDNLLKNTGGNA